MTNDPVTIYQAHLDRVSEAIWSRDHDALTATMTYPHEIIYAGDARTVVNEAALRSYAVAARDRLEEVGASAYLRVCQSAAYDIDDTSRILGTHTTFVLRGGGYIVPPYTGRMSLMRQDGIWLGTGLWTCVDPTQIELLNI